MPMRACYTTTKKRSRIRLTRHLAAVFLKYLRNSTKVGISRIGRSQMFVGLDNYIRQFIPWWRFRVIGFPFQSFRWRRRLDQQMLKQVKLSQYIEATWREAIDMHLRPVRPFWLNPIRLPAKVLSSQSQSAKSTQISHVRPPLSASTQSRNAGLTVIVAEPATRTQQRSSETATSIKGLATDKLPSDNKAYLRE